MRPSFFNPSWSVYHLTHKSDFVPSLATLFILSGSVAPSSHARVAPTSSETLAIRPLAMLPYFVDPFWVRPWTPYRWGLGPVLRGTWGLCSLDWVHELIWVGPRTLDWGSGPLGWSRGFDWLGLWTPLVRLWTLFELGSGALDLDRRPLWRNRGPLWWGRGPFSSWTREP